LDHRLALTWQAMKTEPLGDGSYQAQRALGVIHAELRRKVKAEELVRSQMTMIAAGIGNSAGYDLPELPGIGNSSGYGLPGLPGTNSSGYDLPGRGSTAAAAAASGQPAAVGGNGAAEGAGEGGGAALADEPDGDDPAPSEDNLQTLGSDTEAAFERLAGAVEAGAAAAAVESDGSDEGTESQVYSEDDLPTIGSDSELLSVYTDEEE
jgi:hypothetical protein